MESREDFHAFMQSQISEIEIHKWLESEKAGHDLGQKSVMEWIEKYSAKFRKKWLERRGKNDR